MCGIYGYVGPRPLSQMPLRTRAAGISWLRLGRVALKLRTQAIVVERAVGRVEQLNSVCSARRSPTSPTAWGWRTRAGRRMVRRLSATPIRTSTCRHDLAVVHNGIIEKP